jgi:hypothetical protein
MAISYAPSQGQDIRRCNTRSPRQEVQGEEEEDDKNEKFHASRFSLSISISSQDHGEEAQRKYQV